MPTAIKKSFTYGSHTVTLETGEVARQAHGAVIVNMDDTVVLATVVAAKTPSRVRTSSPLLSITLKSSTLPAVFLVVSSSVKAVRPRRKPLLPA